MAGGESGLKLNQLHPGLYPVNQAQAGATREQVKAELATALRTGNYVANGEIDGQCNELHPNMHPAM